MLFYPIFSRRKFIETDVIRDSGCIWLEIVHIPPPPTPTDALEIARLSREGEDRMKPIILVRFIRDCEECGKKGAGVGLGSNHPSRCP